MNHRRHLHCLNRGDISLAHGISEELLRIDSPDEVEVMSPSDRELLSCICPSAVFSSVRCHRGCLRRTRSIFCFVESWWFHLLAASVICCNTVSIVLEADSEDHVVHEFSAWLP